MRRVVAVCGAERIPVDVAEGVLERTRGLIGSNAERGLLLRRTRSVHTFGMRVPIDAVLLDAASRVVDVVHLRPGRVLLPRRRVRSVLELRRSPFRIGDVVRFEEVRGQRAES